MSAYAWIITEDKTGDTASGTLGPRGITPEQEQQLHLGDGAQFRMKDDDGEIYYEGRFLGDVTSELAFGPLDDFGQPNAGCTSIEYFNPAKEKWQVL